MTQEIMLISGLDEKTLSQVLELLKEKGYAPSYFSKNEGAKDGNKIQVRDIEIDLAEHIVKKAGKPIELTYTQFKLLYLLAANKGQILTRKKILKRAWPNNKWRSVTIRTVDVHIKRLREKLGDDDIHNPRYIETMHGGGYRFILEEE